MIRTFNLIRRMATAQIPQIPDVDIDPQGVFKYILIKVSSPDESGKFVDKNIVRGYAECPYHSKYTYLIFFIQVPQNKEIVTGDLRIQFGALLWYHSSGLLHDFTNTSQNVYYVQRHCVYREQ